MQLHRPGARATDHASHARSQLARNVTNGRTAPLGLIDARNAAAEGNEQRSTTGSGVVAVAQTSSELGATRRHQGSSYTRLMPRGFVSRSLGGAARRVPGLRHLPVLKLLAAAEIALLARDHLMRLNPHERHRLVELVRKGRGRRRNLSESERQELVVLIAAMQPRLLAGRAAEKISPLHLPRRLVYGPRRRT